MDELVATETLVIELLLIVSIVAIVVRRVRVPYTVALVVVGLLITFRQPLKLDLTPSLILALFVPPLIFEAAFHLDYRRLRDNLLPILALAVPGVVLTTLVVGLIVSLGVGISFASGLVFGALISATDPVAVVALFRALGAPRRLVVIVESESLFNDGTAIVVFNLVLASALATAPASSDPLALLGALIEFLRVSIGGIAIGVGLGLAASRLIARLDDYLIETTLTTVLAFGAYLLGESLHVSGVLAVVGAGIVCGNIGLRGMSPTTRIVLLNFWEYLAFIANSLIFLLIGLNVNLPQLMAQLKPISLAVMAVVVSRGLVVYGLAALVNTRRRRLLLAFQHVLFWGGLRGAIGLALALSLPASLADRGLLQVMAFGVVLFTLLAQGTAMNLLLRRLGLIEREPAAQEYERRHGRLMALLAARDRLARLHRTGMLSAPTWQQVEQRLNNQIAAASAAQQQLLEEQPTLRAEELDDARREGLRTQRATLAALVGNGVISEDVYGELITEIDAALDREQNISS